MLQIEEYTWAYRTICTRCFGKFMPFLTLFPIGELLNHHNVQTYYIYQNPSETPNVSSRYPKSENTLDHDEDLITTDPIINVKTETIANLNEKLNHYGKNIDKIRIIKNQCAKIDIEEQTLLEERKKYRSWNIDLSESEDKFASIVAGPDEQYKPGDEVFMSYGRYSNRQLLSGYGFALKDNQYNYARIKVHIRDLAADDEQARVLANIKGFCVFKLKKSTFPYELIKVLRGINWKPDLPIEGFFKAQVLNIESLSLSIGLRVLKSARASFPTSLDHDTSLLLNPNLPLNNYFSLLYRKQVKEILTANIKYLESGQEILKRLSHGEKLSQILLKNDKTLIAALENYTQDLFLHFH